MIEPRNNFDATDTVLATRLKEVLPPAGLRRDLMTLAPRKNLSPVWWIALASAGFAVAMLLLALPGRPLDKARADLTRFLETDFQLSVEAKPLRDLQTWLESQDVPPGRDLPDALAARLPEGCRVVDWDGHRASLICFPTEHAGVVHLVIFEGGTFRHLSSSPQLVREGHWSVAAWTSGKSDYLLFGESDIESLRRLF